MLMIENEPNLVTSGRSQHFVVDGYRFSIEIYRLEGEKNWVLEVVDHDNTSHVWDERFKSDDDALKAALQEIESEGPLIFMSGNNVIPFPQK